MPTPQSQRSASSLVAKPIIRWVPPPISRQTSSPPKQWTLVGVPTSLVWPPRRFVDNEPTHSRHASSFQHRWSRAHIDIQSTFRRLLSSFQGHRSYPRRDLASNDLTVSSMARSGKSSESARLGPKSLRSAASSHTDLNEKWFHWHGAAGRSSLRHSRASPPMGVRCFVESHQSSQAGNQEHVGRLTESSIDRCFQDHDDRRQTNADERLMVEQASHVV